MSRQKIYIHTKSLFIYSSICWPRKLPLGTKGAISGGNSIGRQKKNRELLTGKAGRKAIEREDIARESLRWQRRKKTIERFRVK